LNATTSVENTDHLQLHQQAHSTQTTAVAPPVLDNSLQQIQQQTAQAQSQAQYTAQAHPHHPMPTANPLVMAGKESIDYNNYANQALSMQSAANARLPQVTQQNFATDRRNQALAAGLYNASGAATTGSAPSYDPNQLHYQPDGYAQAYNQMNSPNRSPSGPTYTQLNSASNSRGECPHLILPFIFDPFNLS
jgi:hypothetical protein